MSNSVKVTLYAVLVLLASISGYFALTNFGRMMARAGNRNSDLEQIDPDRKSPAETSTDTNVAVAVPTTNVVITNVISAADTNGSNALSFTTNAVVTENTNSSSTQKISKASEEVPSALSARSQSGGEKRGGRIALWTALFVVSLIGLGLMIASDVSQFFGNRALKTLYNDEGEGVKDPEYDKAEELWANGQHLDAIKMMREYLAKNPREQHVSIRIAEIYEKDLQNNLAAALEYEEVLKHKLVPERWAWAAIHLCNLYFRLNQEQKGFELLRRIVNEHPGTAAAEKARKRLEQIEGTSSTEQPPTEAQISAAPRSVASTPPAAPSSHLPPGFRPKK